MTEFQPGEMVLLYPAHEQPMQRATFLEYHDDGEGAMVRVWEIDRTDGDLDGLRDVTIDQLRKNTVVR